MFDVQGWSSLLTTMTLRVCLWGSIPYANYVCGVCGAAFPVPLPNRLNMSLNTVTVGSCNEFEAGGDETRFHHGDASSLPTNRASPEHRFDCDLSRPASRAAVYGDAAAQVHISWP